MDIRIKATDYEIPTEVAAYLDQKIADIRKLVADPAARFEVELGRSAGHPQRGSIWKAEFVLLQHGERLRAIAEEETINAAIDVAKDEMLQQLRKTKGKSMAITKRLGAKFKNLIRWG